MDIETRIIAFVRLGESLREENQSARTLQRNPMQPSEELGLGARKEKISIIQAPYSILSTAIQNASEHNGWFTMENILLAIGSLGEMLREEKIRKWVSKYPEVRSQKSEVRRIGIIMAGNIPLVGFHDFLCVLMSGNIFVGKLSSDDAFLLPAVSKILIALEPKFEERIIFAPVLKGVNSRRYPASFGPGKAKEVDAFIATGSNNSARYFEYYFRKYPHIIRKNRNAIAILNDTETDEELKNLGKDIFQYFGMGCRSVSKIYVPKDYNLDKFFSAIVDFGDVINHNKYYNNHIYYRTIYLLNKEKFLDNNFLILKEFPTLPLPLSKSACTDTSTDRREGEVSKSENISLSSPVAILYYEYYSSQNDLLKKLMEIKEQIQCIVASPLTPLLKERGMQEIRFGNSQSPELWDYADGVDTMRFLLGL